ncbi:hypothetical protein ACHAW6_001382 [Cyclotella cf. meneghiniana]
MPDLRLKQAVQSVLSSFLEQRRSTHDDIAQDVYRTFRDEANLLLERELIFNSFDSDPFGVMKMEGAMDGGDTNDHDRQEKKKNSDIIARVKKLLSVVSCTRTATADGYSFIQAIVQLDKDENMQGVNDNVRLHFWFLREPQHHIKDDNEKSNSFSVDHADCCHGDERCSDPNENESHAQNSISVVKRKHTIDSSVESNGEKGEESPNVHQAKKSKHCNGSKGINCENEFDENLAYTNILPDDQSDANNFKPKTIVSYKVEYSVDYGKFEKLFGLDLYASGDVPSVEEAVPLVDGDDASNDGYGDERSKGCKEASEADNLNTQCVDEPPTNESDIYGIEMSSNGYSGDESIHAYVENGNAADRFVTSVEPEQIVKFLDQANMNFDEKTVFYFLLMFPFYEHEWDMSGYLLSTLLDDNNEEEGHEAEN